MISFNQSTEGLAILIDPDSPATPDSHPDTVTASQPAATASADRVVPAALALLSVVIPARDEAGCIASTVEHLHLELALHAIPHEIVVVDDGSIDAT
jgi:hypothetical protein